MKTEIRRAENEMTICLEGRLDTITAPDFELELQNNITEETEKVILDLKDLEYISSAGLRAVLSLQKRMNKRNGSMIVRNVNEMVMEVFEVTGFSDILTIE